MMISPSEHTAWDSPTTPRRSSDAGYTLIELVVAILILGILTAVVVLVVTGMTTEAADTGCQADRRMLDVAVGAREAQTGQFTIAPSGTDHDRYERTLVEGEFLRSLSTMHDLDANGAVVPEAGSSC